MPIELAWMQMYFADHVLGALVCIVAPLLVIGTRQIGEGELAFDSGDKIRLYHQNGLFLAVVALGVVTVWRLPGRSLAGLGFSTPVWTTEAWCLLGIVVAFYAADIFFQYGLRRWRERAGQDIRTGSAVILPANGQELGHFFFLSLAAGVGEEVIFRGFLLHYLVFWLGHTPTDVVVAGVGSSLLFAYLHGYQGWVAMLKIFFLALLFAGLFVMTRSLWPVIILHTLIDGISGWLGVRLMRTVSQDDTSPRDT